MGFWVSAMTFSIHAHAAGERNTFAGEPAGNLVRRRLTVRVHELRKIGLECISSFAGSERLAAMLRTRVYVSQAARQPRRCGQAADSQWSEALGPEIQVS